MPFPSLWEGKGRGQRRSVATLQRCTSVEGTREEGDQAKCLDKEGRDVSEYQVRSTWLSG